MKLEEREKLAAAAAGKIKADLVLKNAKVIDVFTDEVLDADVAIEGGYIAGIGKYEGSREIDLQGAYVAPGFVNAHLHIESSMVPPAEYVKAVLPAGTTTLIADPHEIINVLGAPAMQYLLEDAKTLPVNLLYMQSSCVPSTPFETSGATYRADDMAPFWGDPHIGGLAEVMSVPAVLGCDPDMMKKMEAACAAHKLIDGHAPGLTGKALQAYVAMGVKTDHECTSFTEAREKMRAGQYILIREGSAARNLESIVRGICGEQMNTRRFMFCTDDKHLSDLYAQGDIRWNVELAIHYGIEPVKAIKMASFNAAQAYGLDDLGAVAPGYRADLVVLDRDLSAVRVLEVLKDGVPAEEAVKGLHDIEPPETFLHTVHFTDVKAEDLTLPAEDGADEDVIGMMPNEILTSHLREPVPVSGGRFAENSEYNKLCVVERHGRNGNVAVAPLKGYGISGGAVATSVAHDSHNVIAAGDNDADLVLAINTLKKIDGGYVLTGGGKVLGTLPLPLAGLMSMEPGEKVSGAIARIEQMARGMGVPEGIDPFISLSFMALPVIPSLRLTDRGLFDADHFSMIRK
ncbi:MAG: adenine deaminase [Lachnospiraceae bacterium]|jgi:adenine deaminase|nr:adenine deaminase [Lachnospiraceae bacterium]